MFLLNKKYLVEKGSVTIIERFTKVGFGFGSFLLLVRFLDKETFGVWVIYMTISSIIEITRIGFIKNALIKYYIDYTSERGSFQTGSLLLSLSFSVLIAILIVVSRGAIVHIWKTELLLSLLYYYLFILLFDWLYFHIYFLIQANFDFRGSLILTFIRNGIFFVTVLISYIFSLHFSITTFVLFQIMALFLSTIGAVVLYGNLLTISKFNFRQFMLLWNYGKFNVGTSLSGISFNTLDKLMIGGLLNTVLVAMYDTAMRIVTIAEVPVTALGYIFFPFTSKHVSENKDPKINKIFEETTGILLAIIIPIIIITVVFANFLIILLGGRDYSDAANIMRFGIFVIIFWPFNRQFGVTMDAIGKPRVNFYLNLVTSLINAVMYYIFISKFGVYGAIIASLFTNFISFLYIQHYLSENYKVKFKFIIMNCLRFYTSLFRSVYLKYKSLKV